MILNDQDPAVKINLKFKKNNTLPVDRPSLHMMKMSMGVDSHIDMAGKVTSDSHNFTFFKYFISVQFC